MDLLKNNDFLIANNALIADNNLNVNNNLIVNNARMISILLKINKQWLKYSTSVNTPSIVIIVVMFS